MFLARLVIVTSIAAGLSGCSVDVPKPDDGIFLCDKTEDCAEGYVCVLDQCVKDDGAKIVTFDEGIAAIARKYCVLALGCCADGIPGPDGPITNQASCEAEMKNMMTGNSVHPDVNPRVVYDAKIAMQCFEAIIADIDAATCNSIEPLMTDGPQHESCDQMTKGKQQAGQECDGYDECADNLTCDCQWEGDQQTCTTCRRTVGADANCSVDWCADGLYCDSGTCKAQLPPGQPCTDGQQCTTYCDFGTGKCAPLPIVSDTCVKPQPDDIVFGQMVERLSDAYCATLFDCCVDTVYLMGDTEVTSLDECVDLLAESLQNEFGGDPQANPLTTYDGAAAAQCVGAVEAALQDLACGDTDPLWRGPMFPGCDTMIEGSVTGGGSCSSTYVCAPGHRCECECGSSPCSDCSCEAVSPQDGVCEFDDDCADGLYCDNLKCRPQKVAGSACSWNFECLTRECGGGTCVPAPKVEESCGGGNQCFDEPFAVNSTDPVPGSGNECVDECADMTGCNVGLECVEDPRHPNSGVCRPTCGGSGECLDEGMVCAYAKDAATDVWPNYRACLRPGEWRCALNGYLPAWADANGCGVPNCRIEGTYAPEDLITGLGVNDYVRDLQLVGRKAILEVNNSNWDSYLVLPVTGDGTMCSPLNFPSGRRHGMAVMPAGDNILTIGTTCFVQTGGTDCRGGAASTTWFEVHDVATNSYGCGVNPTARGSALELQGWDVDSFKDMTAGANFFAVSGARGPVATPKDEIYVIHAPDFNYLNPVNLPSVSWTGHGWLGATGSRLFYTQLSYSGDVSNAELVMRDYSQSPVITTSIERDSYREGCEIVAGKDRVLWTRNNDGSTPCNKTSSLDVRYSEGGQLGGDLQSDHHGLASLSLGDGVLTMPRDVVMSGSVVAWVEQDGYNFEIRAIDVTNCEMDVSNDQVIILASRESSSTTTCPGTANMGTKWSVDAVAIDSHERGMLTLAFVATCKGYDAVTHSKQVFSRVLFDR
ncbi:MAG: hypothetical protein A2289_25450 [Deltaproteobacteria bacterium RIFOXYA12_FULL_58_15]|nr:MAG: hypothetical protein A2289_25450 [Deltaproteobacteria bacterium RIFOXYA12_FULL_58_15]OGR09040.1 MAG: hypothetical protein A2341_25935 [Deltaproteobacteria bacterium RIFOXYB12_FULL_58_9]